MLDNKTVLITYRSNMETLKKKAWELARKEWDETGFPFREHIDIAVNKAKSLAKQLNADPDIVEIGTLMMDVVIGQAIKDGNIQKHVEMCLDATNGLLKDSQISEDKKENIRNCVIQHHGVDQYYSIEAEICANSDCYRWLSTRGFACAMKCHPQKDLDKFIEFAQDKRKEMLKLLSLTKCKNELQAQLEIVDSFLDVAKTEL